MDAGVWSQQRRGNEPAFYLKQRLFSLLSLSNRASEERIIIQDDLKTAEAFYQQELAKARQALLNYSSSSRFDHGAVAALSAKVEHFQNQLKICNTMSKHFQTDCVAIVEEEEWEYSDIDTDNEDGDDDSEGEEVELAPVPRTGAAFL